VTKLTEAVEGSSLAALNKGEQFASFDVDAFEVPGGRDEIWRFTPLRRLRGLHDGSAPATASAQITVSERPGVQVETVRRGDQRLGDGGAPTDRVAAQAFSSFNSATLVTVARDTQVADPVEVVITGPGAGAVAYGHLQIRVEELAEAVVVIDQRGSGTYADNVEFVVDDAARLTVVWIADWADDTVHVSAQHARLGKDAVLRHVAVTLGGGLVRMSATVRFDAPGGDAELLGHRSSGPAGAIHQPNARNECSCDALEALPPWKAETSRSLLQRGDGAYVRPAHRPGAVETHAQEIVATVRAEAFAPLNLRPTKAQSTNR